MADQPDDLRALLRRALPLLTGHVPEAELLLVLNQLTILTRRCSVLLERVREETRRLEISKVGRLPTSAEASVLRILAVENEPLQAKAVWHRLGHKGEPSGSLKQMLANLRKIDGWLGRRRGYFLTDAGRYALSLLDRNTLFPA